MKLSTKILVALAGGIVFGAILNLFFQGAIAPINDYLLTPVGKIFLRLIQFVVVPIVFTSLIIGLTSIKDSSTVGRYTGKLVFSYLITSFIALMIGIFVAFLIKPGENIERFATDAAQSDAEGQPLISWLISVIPVNPFEALSTGNLLQIIIAAVLIGIGIHMAGEKAAPVLSFIESLYEIIERVMSIVLKLAPIGVFALISSVIATQGFDLLAKLVFYVIGLIFAILLMVLVYGLLLFIIKGQPIFFFKSFAPAFSLAFGTASSNATLPLAIENAEKRYEMKKEMVSFAIPFGTALKRDGAAILQGFNAVFVAQLFDVEITAALLSAIIISALLVSFSTAGVPGAGIIMMTTVLTAAGLPLEGVAIVAGVDRLTDGFRTALNVIGNTANAAILKRWERS